MILAIVYNGDQREKMNVKTTLIIQKRDKPKPNIMAIEKSIAFGDL